jgi:hypothetical protein
VNSKPSPICDAYSTLPPCFLILFLVKKFDLISFEFGPKNMQSHKKKFDDQIENEAKF